MQKGSVSKHMKDIKKDIKNRKEDRKDRKDVKKRIYGMTLLSLSPLLLLLLLTAGLCSGCGKEETESNVRITENQSSEVKEQSNPADMEMETEKETETEMENNNTEWNDEPEIDFTYDYSEDIKADVDYMVSDSASLQEEMENIDKIIQKYTPLAEAAQTQIEMNDPNGFS